MQGYIWIMFYSFTRFLNQTDIRFSQAIFWSTISGKIDDVADYDSWTSLEWIVVCYYTTAVSAKQNNRVSCSRSSNRKGQHPKKNLHFSRHFTKNNFWNSHPPSTFHNISCTFSKIFQMRSFLYFFGKICGGSFHNWLKPRLIQKCTRSLGVDQCKKKKMKNRYLWAAELFDGARTPEKCT